jgi:hypothetical protein
MGCQTHEHRSGALSWKFYPILFETKEKSKINYHYYTSWVHKK